MSGRSIRKGTFLWLILLLSACTTFSRGFHIEADVEGIPSVGEEVALEVIVSSRIAAPTTKVEITIPEGVEVIESETIWEGAIQAGGSQRMLLHLRVLKAGEWPISINVFSGYTEESEGGFGEVEELRIISDQESGRVEYGMRESTPDASSGEGLKGTVSPPPTFQLE